MDISGFRLQIAVSQLFSHPYFGIKRSDLRHVVLGAAIENLTMREVFDLNLLAACTAEKVIYS